MGKDPWPQAAGSVAEWIRSFELFQLLRYREGRGSPWHSWCRGEEGSYMGAISSKESIQGEREVGAETCTLGLFREAVV